MNHNPKTAIMAVGVGFLWLVSHLAAAPPNPAPPVPTPDHQWLLTPTHVSGSTVTPQVGELALQCEAAAAFDTGPVPSLVFRPETGRRAFLSPSVPFSDLPLPARQLSAEAWVRVDASADWGGFFGAIQDNGTYERGWLLGFRRNQFFFALVSEKTQRLTYLTAPSSYAEGYWYHLVGTWDGRTQCLYIDGKLVASSTEQSGAVSYPPEAHFGIGAYWDSNEFYPLSGAIERVSLWSDCLDAAAVHALFLSRKNRFPDIEPEATPSNDWPTHLQNNRRTGLLSGSQLNFPLRLTWSRQERHAPSPAWPPPARQDFWHRKSELKARITFDRAYPLIAVEDSLFVSQSTTNRVLCLNANTGAVRWQYDTEGPVRLAPTYHDGRVLFGSDDGRVYCISAAEGELLWRFESPGRRLIQGNGRIIDSAPIRTGVLVDEGTAYFCRGLFPQQGVEHVAVDIASGKVVGTAPLNAAAQGYLERRATRLHVATGRDPAGAFVAQLQRRGKAASPATTAIPEEFPFAFIGDDTCRIGGGDGQVAAFDVQTGETKWRADIEGRAYNLAIARGRLFVSTDTGMIYCFTSAGDDASNSPPRHHEPLEPSTPGPSSRDKAAARAATEILAELPFDKGWALVIHSGRGELCRELTRQSSLQVIGIEADRAKWTAARQMIQRAGLDDRVTFHQLGAGNRLPYSDYLFNLVVDADAVLSLTKREAEPSTWRAEALRVTRPNGGLTVLGPNERITRPALEGAGEWTHQYANPGNTVCSDDRLVGNHLKLQWFGAPGPRPMMDRHHRTAAPLWSNGRLFIPGNDRVIAADGYNGTPLWDIAIPDSRRAGVYRDSSYLAATDNALLVAAAARCLVIDPATGAIRRTLQLPGTLQSSGDEWGFLATVDELVIGSRQTYGATRRDHNLQQIQEGTYYDARPLVCSKALFATVRDNGKPRWNYVPASGLIINSTIAISHGRVYFIESQQTDRAQSTGRHRLSELLREPAKLTALHLATGELAWSKPIDISHIEHVLYLIATKDRLVLAGSYNEQIASRVQAHFDVRVLNTDGGETLWRKTQNQNAPANGSHGEQDLHPVVVGRQLYCEPYAYDLETGEPLAQWRWKAGHRRGCGTISASASTFFFRNHNPTMFDLATNQYSKVTTSTRPGCWINMIPAGGLLLVPEASSGCSCNFAIQSSMAFIPE